MPAGTRKAQVQRVAGTAGPDELRTVAKRLATDIAADAGLLAFMLVAFARAPALS
jgi:hypothetical protein